MSKKILVTADLYSSDRADEIQALVKQGLTPEEIARQLGTTSKSINSYLAYSKGMYSAESPTMNAIRIRACRKRKDGKTNETH